VHVPTEYVSAGTLPGRPHHQMPQSRTTPIRTRLNTYTAYGIGCAAVWAAILVVTHYKADSQTRNTIRLMCLGWWIGWTSATIARVVYPPPTKWRSTVTTT
jgi:hypothetical protein